MKKKILILTISVLVLIAVVAGGTYFYVNSIKVDYSDSRKSNVYEKLTFFARGEVLEETSDPILKSYNDFLKKMLLIDMCNFDTFKGNITIDSLQSDNINKTKELIIAEKKQIEPLFNVYDNDITFLVKNDSNEELYLSIYNDCKYVLNKIV